MDYRYGNNSRPVDPYARGDPSGRMQKADPYGREDIYSRPQKVNPYSQEEPYGQPPKADPYSRDGPYSRPTKPSSYDMPRPQPPPSDDRRYRSDVYARDESTDERETPPPGSRGSSDYRERSDRRLGNGFAGPVAQPNIGKEQVVGGPSVIYELDHLATFNVSPKQGLVKPTDGVKRLRDMEASSGIWAMKVQLRIDRREIVVLEKATQKELDSFAVSRVSSPAYIASGSPGNLYNNIVLFIVQSESGPRSPSEMHLFQCLGVSGQEVVDDIEAAVSGRFPRNPAVKEPHRRSPLPSPRSSEDNYSGLSALDDISRQSAAYDDMLPTRRQYNDEPRQMPYNNQPYPPPAAQLKPEYSQDDVTMLNHCADDIELFVKNIQQVAVAQKELERRRMMYGGQDRADEALRARAQPPPPDEFVSTLQKFKTALNLLPKLRNVLADPDAEQLMHMLFPLLELIINTLRDERGIPTVAQKIESPLLTAEACSMMEACLNQREKDLWRSLGQAWNIPVNRWPGPLPPPYMPRFNDGWQHPGLSMSALNTALPAANSAFRPPMQQEPGYGVPSSYSQSNGSTYGQQPASWNAGDGSMQRGSSFQGYQQMPPQGQQQQQQQQQMNPYTQPPVQPLGMQPDQVPGLPKVPSQPQIPESQPAKVQSATPNPAQLGFLNNLKARGARIYVVISGREGKNPKELNVETGDVVEIMDSSKNWWKVKNHVDQLGFVPFTLLAPYSD